MTETPAITIANYILWTGDSAPQMTDAQWARVTNTAAARLLSFLCMDELPDPMPDDFEELLANFLSAIFARSGSKGEVESKTVRNFHITFRTKNTANAFADIYADYADIIGKYSQCDSALHVEHNERYCCGR